MYKYLGGELKNHSTSIQQLRNNFDAVILVLSCSGIGSLILLRNHFAVKLLSADIFKQVATILPIIAATSILSSFINSKSVLLY